MTLGNGARTPATTAGLDRNGHHEIARILVTDDEPKLVDVIRRALSAEGFLVDGATDGASALAMIRVGNYDLVVLDLVMDRIDGLTVLEHAMESHPHLPVVVLSGRSDVETKVRCFELGAADYVTKPFALAELIARIRARIGPPVGGDEAILQVKGLRLDLMRRTAHSYDTTVHLSNREFLLLRYLMRYQGKVCSRARLLEDVWGCQFDPGTNVVDVYVGRLRAKLGSSVIATVRNAGYCVPAGGDH
jgi:two-component system, OmpR family, response regulator